MHGSLLTLVIHDKKNPKKLKEILPFFLYLWERTKEEERKNYWFYSERQNTIRVEWRCCTRAIPDPGCRGGGAWCTHSCGSSQGHTHTPWFRCEESQRCAKMSSDSQPFSSQHRITKNTLGKQSILWGIVRCWPNDWQEVKWRFITDSNNNCWWILHGIFQKTELTEGFLTFYLLESTCTIMGMHSEWYSHIHAHKNPSG